MSAFETLYRRHRDWVLRVARRFSADHEDALDVLQDTFAHLLDKSPALDLRVRLTTYLYPVVKHLALTRRQKRRRAAGVGDEPLVGVPAPRGTNPSASRDELAAVLARLPDGQREVLLMRVVDDLSLAEIADVLQLPVGTVKSRLHHALRTLRDDPRTQEYFDHM